MKSLFSILTLITSFCFAGSIEPGKYTAIDVDSKSIIATLIVRADLTSNLMLKAPDFTMPEPGCNGVYNVVDNILKAEMICPVQGLEKINVTIDITHVTPAEVRVEPGVVVDVVIDALGTEAYKFNLKKIE